MKRKLWLLEYLSHLELFEPMSKLVQILGHCSKTTLVLLHASRFTQQNAGRNRALVYL